HGDLDQRRRSAAHGHSGEVRVGYGRHRPRRVEDPHLQPAWQLLLHLQATSVDVWASHRGEMRDTMKPPLVLVLVALALPVAACFAHGEGRTATGRTPQPGGVLQPRDMARLEVGRVL